MLAIEHRLSRADPMDWEIRTSLGVFRVDFAHLPISGRTHARGPRTNLVTWPGHRRVT
jgi:hypothetical protein